MKIKNLSSEEIEQMSYNDLAYLILKDAGKKMKIKDLFKKVCQLMNLDDATFESHIAAFFELLSTEKRFIMLENGYWDLKDNHSQQIVIDEEDDEDFQESSGDIEEIDEDEEDIYDDIDETDDIVEDDLKDFAVVSEEDEENTAID